MTSKSNRTRFRVGSDKEGVYVWDREMQPSSRAVCLLWHESIQAFHVYETRLVKAYVKAGLSSNAEKSAIESYRRWFESHGDQWVQHSRSLLVDSLLPLAEARSQRIFQLKEEKEEQHRQEELRQRETAQRRRENAEFKHQEHLAAFGLPNIGIRRAAEGRVLRITHCWQCKNHLDSSIDIECAACNWIICACGACGCGYSDAY